MIKKFLQDYVSYQLSHVLGGKKYQEWAEQTLTLQKNVPIKNKKLAQELEDACAKKGFLTYSEFLMIDQFGTHGYHHNHANNGMTDVRARWPAALAALCKTKNIHNIVEFGPGDGLVGASTLLEAKKQGQTLYWSGVEISEKLRHKTEDLFRKKGIEKQLMQLVPSLSDLQITKKCLFVFSYSLDNLVPEVFITTQQKPSYPNAMVGLAVKHGMLSEVILTEKEIATTGCSLKNGMYTDADGFTWNLNNWQLNCMQRLYAQLDAYRILYKTFQLLPKDSQILIIDEFRESTHLQTFHHGLPRDLETFSRDFTDMKKLYVTAGDNLLYFPLFLDPLITFLSQIGCSLEKQTGEHALAYKLSDARGPLPKHPRTFALLTSPKKKEIKKKQFIV